MKEGLYMKNFVDHTWLETHLNDPSLFIFDCRFDLYDPAYGRKSYEDGHIQNAFFLDINEDLSGEQEEHGGARPRPNLIHLVKSLEVIGLRMDSTIICYDDQTYSSGRAWWQLKEIGFKNIYILDGGYKSWTQENLPITTEKSTAKQTGKIIVTSERPSYCNIEYVKNSLDNPNMILVDSREHARFTGAYEPLYTKKGHIPSAQNVDCSLNFTSEGKLHTLELLIQNFSHLDKCKEIIAYCGSGISAAINFAILDELGYNVKLYIGSVSDWISYDENPLETGPAIPLY